MTFSSPPPSPKSHAKAPHANKKHDGGVNNPSSSALSSFDFILGILHHQRRVVFAFVFVLFSSSSSSNRVSVSYSDQKKTISLIADIYLAKLSLLKRSSSMRNENDDSSDFLERLSMSRQNERRKEAMREAHERKNFIYPVFSNNNKTTLSFFFLNGPFFRFRVPLFSARHISRRIHTHTNALSSSFG